MKWRTKSQGLCRIVRRFAFWPTPLATGYTVWLQTFYEYQRVVEYTNGLCEWTTIGRYEDSKVAEQQMKGTP
jgi:hypothetical protein